VAANLRAARELIDAGARVAFCPQPGPQTAALACPVADLLFGGARGGGKTHFLLGDWLKHQALYGAAAKGILLRRTYAELDEVQAQAQEMFPAAGAVYRAGRQEWQFPSGARLKLRYLGRDADAQHYQGHSYTWIAVDEAGNFASPDPIDKLRATLRSKTGVPAMLRLTANPGGPGHGWLKKRYVDPAPPMVPHFDPLTGTQRVFIPSLLTDNALLMRNDPTYAQRIRASGPAWLVAAWLNGDWNASPDGGIVLSQWFRRYLRVPPEAHMVVHSWDTAQKSAQINDPSCLTSWRVGHGAPGAYLAEVFTKRLEYPALRKAVMDWAARDRPNAILIEDKASGTSLIQDLRGSTTLPIIPVEPEGDKATRMFGETGAFEAGRVFFPESAPWLLDYELELTIFPLAPHDDQVDSTSQFLRWWRLSTGRIDSASTGGRVTATATTASAALRDNEGYGAVGRTRLEH